MYSACRVGKIAGHDHHGGVELRNFAHASAPRPPTRGQRARAVCRFAQACVAGALPTLQVLGLLTLPLAIPPARAQTPDLGEIHGLKLGLEAPSMSMGGFGELACGSNGGPPRQRLDGWAGFAACRAEPNGLHEVYARFDDEDEFIGRAIDDPLYAGGRTGTRVAGHPVILSVLFDDAGVLRGLRFTSDPRAAPVERRMAHLLRLAIINRYDPAGWTCADLAAEPGETPVGGIFIKQHCEKLTPERRMTLDARFLRKPGQSDIDPTTGDYTSGQFESSTRFELVDPAYRKP
jgi:hypothetical protein